MRDWSVRGFCSAAGVSLRLRRCTTGRLLIVGTACAVLLPLVGEAPARPASAEAVSQSPAGPLSRPDEAAALVTARLTGKPVAGMSPRLSVLAVVGSAFASGVIVTAGDWKVRASATGSRGGCL
jgi:hypothetical protein